MANTDTVYPLLCKPVLKSKIWGGRKLEDLFQMPLPEGEKIGEAWIVADLPEGSSSVANGPLEGRSLSDIAKEWGESLLGKAWQGRPTGDRFPLLIKLLDAQDDLSVQVHPDDAACRKYFPNDFSKDESWVVMHADPGGKILHGFRPETSSDDFDQLLKEGKVEACLRAIEVNPGEVYRVAPGTVHALCRGVVILEIQEPSDTTFRIYDYGRMGDDGKPRPLHLEQARKVMEFGADIPSQIEPQGADRPWGRHELLVDVPAYRIERLDVQKAIRWNIDPASAQVVIVTDGALTLNSGETSLDLKKGDCVILPAALGSVHLEPKGKAQCVLAGAWRIPMAVAEEA